MKVDLRNRRQSGVSRSQINVTRFLMCVIIVTSGCATRPALESGEPRTIPDQRSGVAWKSLSRFKGRNLTWLPDREKWIVHTLIDRVSPFDWQPLFVGDMGGQELQDEKIDRVTVILERLNAVDTTLHAYPLLRARVFSLEGTPRSITYGQIVCGRAPKRAIGYVDVKEVEILRTKNGDLLVVTLGGGQETGKLYYAGEYPKQYYALRGDSLNLVRIEDANGKLVRNSRVKSIYPLIGNTHAYSEAEVKWILEVGSHFQKLAVLQWLCSQAEDQKDTEETMNADIREAIRRLSASNDPWLREQASLALKLSK